MAEEKPDRGVWVLETQTKGTGANVVPLEKALKGPAAPVSGFGFKRRPPREPEPPAPREPYRFKITDVMTREVLAEAADAREAVRALEGVRSIVDVVVHVWEPAAQRWRMLTFGETRALWDRRAPDRES